MARLTYITEIMALSLVAFRGAGGIDTSTVTISAAPAYAVQPACVQTCLYDNFPGNNVQEFLLAKLGCVNPIYNACYCTHIIAQTATSYLSSCVTSECTGTTEISNAISVYEGYCSGAGYPPVALVSSTTSSISSSSTPEGLSSTSTPTATAASTTKHFSMSAPPTASSMASPSSAASPTISPTTLTSSSLGTPAPTSSKNASTKIKVDPILGGLVGCVAGLGLAVWVFYA